MKDLLEKILLYLPVYIPDLVRIVSGPKRFVAERNNGDEGELIKAFTFLGVSLAIFFILQADIPVRGRGFVLDLGIHGILYLLFVVFLSAVLRFSWKIVGGKAEYQGFLVTTSYLVGVLFIGLAIGALFFTGILAMFYPDAYSWFIQFLKAPSIRDAYNPDPGISRSILVALMGFLSVAVLTLVWGFVAWGAYRELNQLPRSRSCAAFFLTILIFLPVAAGLFVLGWK
jgi:hypothetical protein